ncbi:MAG: fibronectin type III domain-containing protein [Litorilinea sp.]
MDYWSWLVWSWLVMRQVLSIAYAIILVLSFGSVAFAQVSTNHDLTRYAITGGGGTRTSANASVMDVQTPLIGRLSSATAVIQAGPLPVLHTVGGGGNGSPDAGCAAATPLNTDGTAQARTFDSEGATHWYRFTAQANRTYVIELENLGEEADGLVFLYDTCAASPSSGENNTFGSLVRLEWDSAKNGDFYIRTQQYEPALFGADTNYTIRVTVDSTPPSSPTNLRCISIDATTIGVQWRKSPERDVTRYRIGFRNQSGSFSGSEDVPGAETTYYELGDLTTNEVYLLRARALDFSGNESQQSGEVQCTARAPEDPTVPTIGVQQPTASNTYSTTADTLTFTGQAADSGNNLSRVQVRNVTKGEEAWDYSLSGGSSAFRVEDMPIGAGDNVIRVTAYDTAGNSVEHSVVVRRLGGSPGAAIIVAGHNETFGLQTNIYNSTNRAYRIFRSAGFSHDDIFYIAPVAQDANNDGNDNVDQLASPAAVENAITNWAATKVGPDKPLFIYMMDHGLENRFCVTGCGEGNVVTPQDLDAWLNDLEAATDVAEVNVVLEACVSGSFVNRQDVVDSISKLGRVVITSTGFNNNAYASAQGAYFSDAFFSCVADSGSLHACFDEARNAVLVTGVNQTPMLDDNGDGTYNAGDGSIAKDRFVTRFFSSIRPRITGVDVARSETNGVLNATVDEGAEEVTLVWAAVYPPSFEEPDDVTINLNVPVVRLEPVEDQSGEWQVEYPNGFLEEGDYRIIFYAQDRIGLHAAPVREGDPIAGDSLYIPVVER